MERFDIQKIKIDDGHAEAITSVLSASDGYVYFGLTSAGSVLYRLDPRTGKLEDLDFRFPRDHYNIDIMDKIHNSLVFDGKETIFIGQGLNISWCAGPYDFDLAAYGGGHLYGYNIRTGAVSDHGLPVPFNAIHGLTIDKKRGRLYGYTIPDNHFFSFDIASGKMKDFGKISMYCCHNFVVDDRTGNVYGAWKKDTNFIGEACTGTGYLLRGTFLLKYDYAQDKMMRTHELLVYGQEYDIFANVGVDSFLSTSTGRVFGSTAIGGALFEVMEDARVEYVGKPVLTPRLTCMVEQPDGLILGGAGFPFMHLFTLDPATREIHDLGQVSGEGDFCYFHGITITAAGEIYAGETDAGRPCIYKLTPKG